MARAEPLSPVPDVAASMTEVAEWRGEFARASADKAESG